MKINILLGFLLLLCFSCKEFKDAEIPADLPRMPEVCAQYEKLLASAEDGWIVEYQPTAKSGFISIYMKFYDNGTAEMQSNYIGYTEVQKEIRYRVGGMVLPELIFETACVWTELYHKQGGEYMFTLEIKSNDTLLLKPAQPPFDRPACIATRANTAQKESFYTSVDAAVKLNQFVNNASAYFKNLELTGPQGNVMAFIEFNTTKGLIHLTYQDELQSIITSERQYKLKDDRIILIPAAIIGDTEIRYLQLGDVIAGNLSIPDAGDGLSGELATSHTPPFPYKGSAEQYTNFHRVLEYSDASEKMKELTAPILDIAFNHYYLDFRINEPYFGYPNNFIICTTKSEWLYYSVDISPEGEDIVYQSYIAAHGDGNKYMDIVKPFLDKMCDPQGYTIVWSPSNKKIFTLVSRSDSRYWITFKDASN